MSLKPKEEELSEECVCEPPRVCLCCFACTEGLTRCPVLSCPVPRRQTQIIPLVCYSRVLKGAAVEVPWEHDDSVVPGLPAFTRRLIDMPGRANGIWSRTKQNTALKQRRGRLVLSQTQSGLPPPPPEAKLRYCQPRFCLYGSPDLLSCTVPPCPTQADTNHTTCLLLKGKITMPAPHLQRRGHIYKECAPPRSPHPGCIQNCRLYVQVRRRVNAPAVPNHAAVRVKKIAERAGGRHRYIYQRQTHTHRIMAYARHQPEGARISERAPTPRLLHTDPPTLAEAHILTPGKGEQRVPYQPTNAPSHTCSCLSQSPTVPHTRPCRWLQTLSFALASTTISRPPPPTITSG